MPISRNMPATGSWSETNRHPSQLSSSRFGSSQQSFTKRAAKRQKRTNRRSQSVATAASSLPRVSPAPTSAPRAASIEAHGLDRGVDESNDHIIMAVDVKEKGRFGCAYYVAGEERLFCMEDIPKGGIDVFDLCMQQPFVRSSGTDWK